MGVTAYTLGLRHAFDADHIGAIDNTTRKLMSEGQRPLSVGFFFSLGHSSIVFALGALFVLGVRGLSGAVDRRLLGLHQATGLVGPVVSGTFLFVIGILNLIILISIVGIFRRMRRGDFDERELEAAAQQARLHEPLLRARDARDHASPWHMYPLGCLFGLGFDTATEIALLVLAGAAAAGGLPFYAILCLPILFAAGMSLLDTIDGAFMNFAYGWAFSKPVRKVFYNITVTGLSVAVALLIGTIELLSVLADKLSLTGRPLGLRLQPRPQRGRLRHRRSLRRSPGRVALGRLALRRASRSGGRRTCDRSSRSADDRRARAPAAFASTSIDEVAEALRGAGHRLTTPAAWSSTACSPPRDRSRPSDLAERAGRAGQRWS